MAARLPAAQTCHPEANLHKGVGIGTGAQNLINLRDEREKCPAFARAHGPSPKRIRVQAKRRPKDTAIDAVVDTCSAKLDPPPASVDFASLLKMPPAAAGDLAAQAARERRRNTGGVKQNKPADCKYSPYIRIASSLSRSRISTTGFWSSSCKTTTSPRSCSRHSQSLLHSYNQNYESSPRTS